MRRAEGFAVVSASWLLIAGFAGIPYMWAGLGPIDATFEAMSGLTTTGATVFRDFSQYGRSVFFWRALTTWLGGMGVIALFVAILPRLADWRPRAVLRRSVGTRRREGGAADSADGGDPVATVCRVDGAADHRAADHRIPAVRCGLQHVRDDFRRGLFSASALDRRLPEPCGASG